MQEVQYNDGSFSRQFFEARDDAELKKSMKEQYDEAMKGEVQSIRQVVLDPDQLCPCGSGRKTKNCCLKRLRASLAKGATVA